MKTLRLLLGLLSLFLMSVGCGRAFDIAREYDEANRIYQGQDGGKALDALLLFIERAESNESAGRKATNLDYDRALSMMWLRLASIYEIEKLNEKRDDAMQHAIKYFDRIEQFTRDPDYNRDRSAWLRTLLIRTEDVHVPEWKKSRAEPKS